MAKDKLTDYDSTAANNLDVGGISVAEGMLPSGVNNAIREQMSHLADFAAGTSGVDVLKLQDDTDTNSIKLQAPSSVTTTTTFTLPDGDGASGQTMITDGAGTLSWAAPYGSRNLIINGAMQVFQRATSATNPGGGYDAADRWRQSQNNSGLGNFTIEQSTDAPDGFATSLKLTKSGTTTQSASVSAYIQQYFEGQNLQQLQYGGSGAKKVTLSFYVKSSLTGTWGVCLQDGEAGKHNAQTYTISSANTWEYKTVTFAGDTAAGIANDNSAEFDVQFVLGAGTDYQTATTNTWASGNKKTTSSQTQWPETDGATWLVTGVQLEVGEQATPFEHRSYGDELARCMRYYQQISASDRIPVTVGQASNVFSKNLLLSSPMRAQPSLSTSGAYSFDEYYVAGRTQTSASISRNSGNEQIVVAVFPNWTGMTDGNRGNPGVVYNAITKIDAEL